VAQEPRAPFFALLTAEFAFEMHPFRRTNKDMQIFELPMWHRSGAREVTFKYLRGRQRGNGRQCHRRADNFREVANPHPRPACCLQSNQSHTHTFIHCV